MYKFYRDFLRAQWNVYFCHDGKEDYECSFDTVEEASAYCDKKNMALISFGGE